MNVNRKGWDDMIKLRLSFTKYTMMTYAHDDLKTILDLHRKWLWGEAGGKRAKLTGAKLTGAKLSDGVTWGEYLSDVVPALLTAGGRALEDVATEEVWNCHAWDSCPMHAAFGASSLREVPALHRWQAGRFVQLFDARLIPLPIATRRW